MKKQSPFIIAGIVMLGVVMRAPFTALPAILIDVAAGLRVEVSSLGILTSIPLIMFALCSSLAPRLAAKFGMEKLMALVLLVMVLGSGMRVLNLPALYIGTMLVGATIAFINVLLPSLVAANFPKKIGLYTTIYITLMGVAATVASMIAVPIVSSSSWEFFILLITGLVFMAFLIWLPNVKNNHRFASENQGNQKSSIWKNKAAIAFLIFGGLQSVLYYTEITWLPTISQSVGFSKAEAGLMAGFFNMTAIPMSMIIPAVLSRQTKEMRRNIMLAISSVTLAWFVHDVIDSDQSHSLVSTSHYFKFFKCSPLPLYDVELYLENKQQPGYCPVIRNGADRWLSHCSIWTRPSRLQLSNLRKLDAIDSCSGYRHTCHDVDYCSH
ncbi:Cyanate permease [Streptococcus suis 05ZYH33]|nr:Cyanate permease [Streptococcus suis 05ZYH33]